MTKHSDDIRRGLRNPNRYSMDLNTEADDIDVSYDPHGPWCLWSEVEPLLDELYVLRNKVEWLQQADKLVIWDGQQWQVRHEIPKQ